ncbi:MAG: GNAT family N-acetyltransferase [Clostridiaceae bacterium]|nr:GNAT family N-acetyltransferase [Clostridiaceae bacterium]
MYFRELTLDDYDILMQNIRNAFPHKPPHIEERRADYVRRELDKREQGVFVGLFDDNDVLVASMELFEFEMCFKGKLIPLGGTGFVATNFLRKKEKSAKALVEFFTKYFLDRGITIGALYPFNFAFYKKMGFGYATENYMFNLIPGYILNNGDKSNLSYCRPDEEEEVLEFYSKYASITHGMLINKGNDYTRIFRDNQVVVCRINGQITGYLSFRLVPVETHVDKTTDMIVSEMVYQDEETLGQFLTFLASQSDQIERIRLYTTDPYIYYLSDNPDNGLNTAYNNGIQQLAHMCGGSMLKILDLKAYLKQNSTFEEPVHEPVYVKLNIKDSFNKSNNEPVIVKIEGNSIEISENSHFDVKLSGDVSDFTSFAVGAIPLSKQIEYSRLCISDKKWAPLLQRCLGYDKKPVCFSYF